MFLSFGPKTPLSSNFELKGKATDSSCHLNLVVFQEPGDCIIKYLQVGTWGKLKKIWECLLTVQQTDSHTETVMDDPPKLNILNFSHVVPCPLTQFSS